MNVCLINDIWKQASAQYTLLSKRTIHFVRLAMINPWVSRIQVKVKEPDKPPVDRTDNSYGESDYIYSFLHILPSFPVYGFFRFA